MFNVIYNSKIHNFKIFNFSKYPNSIEAPIRENVIFNESTLYDKLGLAVLKPINDGEEFMYLYANSSLLKHAIYPFDDLAGRYIGEVFPYVHDELNAIYREVYKSDDVLYATFDFYESDELVNSYKMRTFYDDGNVFFAFEDQTKEVLKNDELLKINSTLEDMQSAVSISINFRDPNGVFFWSSETYNIIEREPRPEDKYNNIIMDLASDVSNSEFDKIIENMEPNKFIGAREFEITLENGKTKILKGDCKKIYDSNGRFVQISGYAMDISDSYIGRKELMSLNSTVNDVQEAVHISIHYKNADGIRVWTPETYRLIGREPRPEDKFTNIISDLASKDDSEKLYKMLDDLAPNEFLGPHELHITLESGEKKILKVDAKKLYDSEGNFIQKSGYAMDITEEYLMNKELLSLNATVRDVQEAARISVHYKNVDGSYVWTPETYNLIDREPRESDKYNHIILDLLSNKDQEEISSLINKLGPNQFLGSITTTITTESGKVKYIEINAHNIYDGDEFIQRSEYAMDVTDDILRNQELLSLNSTMEDVQAAINISIHYKTSDDTYVWNSETYRLINREPREGDENRHIILELLSEEDKKSLTEAILNLGPNEYLGNHDFKITTESGEEKYILYNARPIYDDEGNFIRRSEFAQDITRQVEYEQALIEADAEKTVLVKEVHHRVKNNLQLITSFISLEERFHGENPQRIVDITRNRISSLALIHERIYNEDNMNLISLKEFIAGFDDKLNALSNIDDIKFVTNIDENLNLSVDYMTPMVLIINELTTNSFKYAFTENQKYKEIFKSIEIYFESGIKMCKYHYKDNGVGLPVGFNLDSSPSLGWQIIKSLSYQLDGEFETFNDNGFNFVLKFQIKDAK